MRVLSAVLLPVLLLAACSAPPQKEVDLAQGAIDAARAAGAEQYAPREYSEATAALQQAHDGIAQRDYRLALTRALDAHDRAQEAAKAAAEGRARARGDAEVALAAATAAVEQLRVRFGKPDVAKLPRREVQPVQKALTDAQKALQEARASITAGEYIGARARVRGIPEQVKGQIAALEAAATKKPVRPTRRTR